MAGESPLATLGVELKGWKLCSPGPANVCIDVIKIKDAEQEENFESCADSVEGEDVESAEVGSSGGKSESQKCKTKSSDGGAEFLFHILDERTEEQRAYKAFLMNTIWGLTIVAVVIGLLLYIIWEALDRSTKRQNKILEMLPQVLAEIRGEQRTRS